MVGTVYRHCHNCGYYQRFNCDDPEITVSDGDSLTVIGPDKCFLCGELYQKTMNSTAGWKKELKRTITFKNGKLEIKYV